MPSPSNILPAVAALLLSLAGGAEASGYLLYLEAQGVAGYDTGLDRGIAYSMAPYEAMQKPSLGFDYVGRISGETGDVAVVAVQARLAWNADPMENQGDVELQIYNASIRYKAGWSDLWVGHSRPALGMSSSFDSHGLLLATPAMRGFGFDRDWGAGIYRETGWGNLAASVTLGTGMPVRFEGNVMAAGRAGLGVLNRDNWTVGLSVAGGRTLETMGNEVVDDQPADLALVAVDAAYLWNNLEHRIEADAGTLRGEDALMLFYRLGILLDPEGRWRIEAQPTWTKAMGEEGFRGDLCLSYLATGDLTVRILYSWDGIEESHRGVLQLYYYRRVGT